MPTVAAPRLLGDLAAIPAELLSGMRAPARGVPGGTSSSPVASTATRGRPWTSTRARPAATSAPTWRAVMCVPAGRTRSPARRSFQAGMIDVPVLTGERMPTTSSSPATPEAASVSSTRTTASAPGGSAAPVRMRTAVPPSRPSSRRGLPHLACHPQHHGAFAEALATSACARRSRPSPSRPTAAGVTSVDVLREHPTEGLLHGYGLGGQRRHLSSIDRGLLQRSRSAGPRRASRLAPGAAVAAGPGAASRLAPARDRGARSTSSSPGDRSEVRSRLGRSRICGTAAPRCARWARSSRCTAERVTRPSSRVRSPRHHGTAPTRQLQDDHGLHRLALVTTRTRSMGRIRPLPHVGPRAPARPRRACR